jgi:hypothetical protein
MATQAELDLFNALNRLAKWRSHFAGWQLGTRLKGDPECDAVRDHREVSMLTRVEVNALTRLLIDKGVCTEEEFNKQLTDEANWLSTSYEERFPGCKATDAGMEYDIPEAAETMKGWRP